jgi:hypothetical protein
MEFKGVDYKRKAAKYRCRKVACTPGSVWVKADRLHTLIPRDSNRWWKYYKRRTSIERAFGWLKTEGGLLPLRIRRLERVQLHADLTMLSLLATRLSRARLTRT